MDIKSGLLEKKDSITKVEIPKGVTAIGESAFYNCTNLESIIIPEGVTAIGDRAFYNCTNLESIIIPEGVTVIGESAFYNCTNLESIIIPETVKKIDIYAFNNCNSLKSIEIPKAVAAVYPGAFLDCNSLEEVSFLGNIIEINKSAFEGCEKLKKIKLPESLEKIDELAFSNCSSLSDIDIPEGIKAVGEDAFSGTDILKKTDIDEYGCAYMGKVLIYSKEEKEYIKIKDSTKVIAGGVFDNYENLKQVEFPNSLERIGNNSFRSCTSLEEISIPEGVKSIGESAFMYSGLKKVDLPDTVVDIGDYAFMECIHLSEINLPKNIENIGRWCFSNTDYLLDMESDEYGCKYVGDILLGYTGKGAKRIKIRDGTRMIAAGAFEDRDFIEGVYIPNSVEIMGGYVFYNCFDLKEVYFQEGSRLSELKPVTFGQCISLEEIELPENLKKIQDHVFINCAFKTITMPENVEYVDPYAISEYDMLEEVRVPKKLKGEYYFGDTYIIDSEYHPGDKLNKTQKKPDIVFY
nr:leucine-rich repeat domain-containing protein [Lachnoanaerobaculum sp. Marseille-Q4761]